MATEIPLAAKLAKTGLLAAQDCCCAGSRSGAASAAVPMSGLRALPLRKCCCLLPRLLHCPAAAAAAAAAGDSASAACYAFQLLFGTLPSGSRERMAPAGAGSSVPCRQAASGGSGRHWRPTLNSALLQAARLTCLQGGRRAGGCQASSPSGRSLGEGLAGLWALCCVEQQRGRVSEGDGMY